MLDGFKRGVSKLFGQGSTPRSRSASSLLDEISPDHMPDGALAALYEMMDARYPNTNKLIRESIDLRAGKMRPAMHENWDGADRENLRADGPEKYERPRSTARRLGAKSAVIARPASGIDPKAVKDSTRIEQWVNGFLAETYADMAVTDLLLNETQTLYLMTPMPSHYEHIPTLYDEFEEEGKHATADEYEQMSPSRRRQYEPATSAGDSYKRMRRRYRLDSAGNTDDGSPEFEVDHRRSAKYFTAEMEDAYARNIPIMLRGPLSRLDFVPINPRFSGKSTEVDGVIVRTLYRKSRLKRTYKFDGADDQLLEPTSSYDGVDGDFYLYELWAYDERHRPFVAYQVGTRATTWADDGATTAVVKLWEEYPGCTELPIAFEYGQHNAGSNADLRVLPFTKPRQQNWLQRDGVLTAMAISVAESGYPTWGQVLTKDGVEAMRALGGDIPLEFRMQPNTVVPLIGQLVELTSKGTNHDVATLLGALESLGEKDAPPPGAFGGEGPTSGIDRAVLGRDLEVAHGDVIEGARRIKEKCGRHALMLGSALGRKCDRPVELYVMTDAPMPDGTGSASTNTRISLPPDLCNGNWDVIAKFPHMPGENLAASSLYLTMLEKGAMLMREFREVAMGDQHPEVFLAERVWEDYYLKNPAGQLDALMSAAEYIKDERMKKLLGLANQGKITSPGPGGFSTAAMGDLLPGTGSTPGMGAPAGPAVAGTGVPSSPAQMSLAGGNAGAIQASAGAAGSPLDGGAPMGR